MASASSTDSRGVFSESGVGARLVLVADLVKDPGGHRRAVEARVARGETEALGGLAGGAQDGPAGGGSEAVVLDCGDAGGGPAEAGGEDAIGGLGLVFRVGWWRG
jgi:hypothetical protein